MAEDILVEQERQSRRFKIWERARQLSPNEVQSVAKLQGLLERGIQVGFITFYYIFTGFYYYLLYSELGFIFVDHIIVLCFKIAITSQCDTLSVYIKPITYRTMYMGLIRSFTTSRVGR